MGLTPRKTGGGGRGLFSKLPFMKYLPCAGVASEHSCVFLQESSPHSGRRHPFHPHCTDGETEAERGEVICS